MTALRPRPINLFGVDHNWLASRLPYEVWTDVEDLIAELMLLWELPDSDSDSDDDTHKLVVTAAQYDAIEACGRVLGHLLDLAGEHR